MLRLLHNLINFAGKILETKLNFRVAYSHITDTGVCLNSYISDNCLETITFKAIDTPRRERSRILELITALSAET